MASSGLALATEHGISVERVQRIAKRCGVDIRGCVEANRLYECDHSFFDVIDTEAKAYWLGFIMADGCVTDGNRLFVALAATDASHVEKLRAALASTHPITTFHRDSGFCPHDTARLGIRSDRLVAGLAAHGVTPRKSFTATPPTLRRDLARHFWRGLVDGNGHITANTQGGGEQWAVGLSGSLPITVAFASFAHDVCGTSAAPCRNHSIWTTRIGGNRMAPVVLQELYGGAAVSLDRKQALYLRAMAHASSMRRA